jgi:hypothetical protein
VKFESEVDVLAILRVLVLHRVDFVVIGGIAVAAHGYVRGTKDVDVVPSPDPDNLGRLVQALRELDASQLELGDFRHEELPLELGVEGLSQGGNWALQTKHGRLDLMQFIAGALESNDDYARLQSEAVASQFEFGTVLFASYEELLDLKTLAGREADLIDIRALREARGDTAP